jgi:PRTRC genetic system protein A
VETPIYLKEDANMEWPEDPVFYMITSDGMMKCRNNPFFRSCVKAQGAPSELEPQKPFMKLRYPKLPKVLLEQVVGFFSAIQKKFDSEAYVCMLWNKDTKEYELFCPEQEISGGHVTYELPQLPPHLMVVGDIHSHVNMSAFASGTDTDDEEFRPGVHIVVGKIKSEPPEFHIEAVVDGTRFGVEETLILEGYEQRTDFPAEWMDKMTKKTYGNASYSRHTTTNVGSADEEYEGAWNAWNKGQGPLH